MADNTILPNGEQFEFWEDNTNYEKTYHVDQNHPTANDENPGTSDKPWKTISKAAETLRPGEKVIIHAGVYREWVMPARGGESPNKMIWYQAAPGEDVVIKGSDLWKPLFEPTRNMKIPENSPAIWRVELNGNLFKGVNPFCLQNFNIQKDAKSWLTFPTMELRRGQLFLDNRQLKQVSLFSELQQYDDAFWVEDDGGALHIRLEDDKNPNDFTFEITTREQVFAPIEHGLSYIRVSGLKIFHAANGVPIPPPQRGALSATRGISWIIEDCEVGYANAVGIDLGGQWWDREGCGKQGYHIIRRNHVHHCGVVGICAWHNLPNDKVLLEDNLITDNGWMTITEHWETAGIKMHRLTNSLIRRNVFLRNMNCASLWLDGWYDMNTRVTQNLFHVVDDKYACHCVFIEINNGPTLIDNNIMITASEHAFYEHDAARCLVFQNLAVSGTEGAIYFRHADLKRFGEKTPWEKDHRAIANIIRGGKKYVEFPETSSLSDFNILAGTVQESDFLFSHCSQVTQITERYMLDEWRKTGNDIHSQEAKIKVEFDEEKLELKLTAEQPCRLPVFQPIPEILPGLASTEQVLLADFFGNPRQSSTLEVGPFVNAPLDGAPINVDPRRKK